MLKTTGSTWSIANSKETKGKVDDNSVLGNKVIDSGKVTNLNKHYKKKKSGKND